MFDLESLIPSDVSEAVAELWGERYDRPRAMFTERDRQYLWGIKEYDSAVTRSEVRSTIRERAENGVLDLFYLTMLEEKQREQVIEQLQKDANAGEFRAAVSGFITFLYLGLDGNTEWLEETIANGVYNAELLLDEADRYGSRKVNVDIDIQKGYNLDELEERAEDAPRTLTEAEIGALVREGRLSAEEVESLATTNNNPLLQHMPETRLEELDDDENVFSEEVTPPEELRIGYDEE